MTKEIVQAFLLIFIAEMGDKTQILAMAFATRYPVRKVILGIGLGSFLNHGLAVILGNYLSTIIPISTIQMIAGFAFVGFAIWTLKSEDEEEDAKPKFQFGPVATVSLAFFLGELGDKTQLTAITLAADASFPGMILVGTVAGMIATGGLGIIIGKKMGDKIPELGIKFTASFVFMFFGLQKLSQTVPKQYMTTLYVVPFLLVVTVIVVYMTAKLIILRKRGIQSAYMKQSKMLHDYTEHVMADLNNICIGPEICGECKKDQCAIGYSKKVIESYKETNDVQSYSFDIIDSNKPFSEDKVIDSLVDTIDLLSKIKDQKALKAVHEIRRQLELIIFSESVEDVTSLEGYFEKIKTLNLQQSKKVWYEYKRRKPVEERIINLGDKISNIYMLMIPEGYVLIDTGYREHYDKFKQKLQALQINITDIKYVFITHAHDDHVGFLNQILTDTNAKVVLNQDSTERLKKGQNSFNGGCSSKTAWLFCQIMKVFGKGKHLFEKVDQEERYYIINNANQNEIETLLTGNIISLPGHTEDSIGLLVDNTVLFCGDASMNGVPSRHKIIIWIENLVQYKKSWEKMINLNFKTIYPTHGKPFDKKKLVKNKHKLNSIKLYRLT